MALGNEKSDGSDRGMEKSTEYIEDVESSKSNEGVEPVDPELARRVVRKFDSRCSRRSAHWYMADSIILGHLIPWLFAFWLLVCDFIESI